MSTSAAAALVACLGEDVSRTEALPGADAGTSDADVPPREDGAVVVPDAATTEAGDGRFCSTQAAPAGVLPGDFFCADFDGADVGQGFVVTVPDGGAVERESALFHSPPASVRTKGNAALTWMKPGPDPIASIDATVRINVAPALISNTTGTIALFSLETTDTQIELRYASGATVNGAAYTGFMVRHTRCAPCSSAQVPITFAPKVNVWVDLHFRWQSNGATLIELDGASVFDAMTVGSTSTSGGVQIGFAPTLAPPSRQWAFDDVVVSLKRQ